MSAQRIKLGQSVPSLSIPRTDVQPGFMARVIILNPDMLFAKYLIYDEKVKRSVEVTQEEAIALRMNPYTNYYMLVGRLNTDLSGRISSDEFKLEYLQMSEKVYENLRRLIEENPNFTHLVITKTKKTNDRGQDVSETKIETSSKPISDLIPQSLVKVQELNAKPGFLESCWKMVDSSTSITMDMYRKRLAELNQGTSASSMGSIPQASLAASAIVPTTAKIPQVSKDDPGSPFMPDTNLRSEADDFGGSDVDEF